VIEVPVPIIFALRTFPFGLALGTALVINVIEVLGFTVLVSPITFLPAMVAVAPLVRGRAGRSFSRPSPHQFAEMQVAGPWCHLRQP
jgi:hypothetical protein